MKKRIPHNKPIASVIRNYMDKKSGKVTESREEIRRRFLGLDWKDQKKIMNAFLDAGKSDREWAFSILLDLWDSSFETKVRELWEEHHDERCAWVIIRNFPLEYLKEHMEELSEDRNYYFICRRLAADADYEINKDLLSATDYLIVLHHSNRTIEDNEATDILFQIAHDISVHWWPSMELSRDYRPDRKEMMSTSDFDKVSMALYYLRKMGKEEVIQSFKKWDDALQERVRQSDEYAELLKQPLSDHDFADMLASIVRKYVGQTLPEKYKRLETNPRENPPGAFISQDEDVDPFQYEEKNKDPSSPPLPF